MTQEVENYLEAYFDGVTQHHDTFTEAAGVITFDSAIVATDVEVRIGVALSIGTPSDSTVTDAKIDSTGGAIGETLVSDGAGNAS